MAGEEYVDVVNGEKILVQIGDGADPEVFTHDCMINAERGVNLTASTIQQSVPRCDDPSAPDLVTREPDAVDSVINGAGKLHSRCAWWRQRRCCARSGRPWASRDSGLGRGSADRHGQFRPRGSWG